MLEVKQYKLALSIAVEGGDPDDINKVINEISKPPAKYEEVIRLVVEIPDGLRHLRNFAKKRKKFDFVKSIYDYVG